MMASMYSKILKEQKEDKEKYDVLRRQCPICNRLTHRLNGKWWCGYCYKKFDENGKEI